LYYNLPNSGNIKVTATAKDTGADSIYLSGTGLALAPFPIRRFAVS
jgi:hypothetical protein